MNTYYYYFKLGPYNFLSEVGPVGNCNNLVGLMNFICFFCSYHLHLQANPCVEPTTHSRIHTHSVTYTHTPVTSSIKFGWKPKKTGCNICVASRYFHTDLLHIRNTHLVVCDGVFNASLPYCHDEYYHYLPEYIGERERETSLRTQQLEMEKNLTTVPAHVLTQQAFTMANDSRV